MNDSERLDWLHLTLTPGLGSVSLCRLLAVFNTPEAIRRASSSQLLRHTSAEVSHAILLGADPQRMALALNWLNRPDNHLLTLADTDYPARLLDITDPPPVLFARGRLDLLNKPALAMVGSRNASAQGERDATHFSRNLAENGLTIISGLALGIDAAAHQGALGTNASTIAVIGTGPDIVYPARNRDLAHTIAAQGLILSELPPGTPAKVHHFPRRNRLISGLSMGCLVVEAGLDSGSLITARLAAEQGKEVFAIPGSIHSPLTRGCHRLIREGAKLVEQTSDILEELHLQQIAPQAQTNPAESNDPLLAIMGHAPIALDTLVMRSGLTAQQVSAILLEKELIGEVASRPGGLYQRLA